MDEDLLFKTHNESKIPEINLNHKKKQTETISCQKFKNSFLKEEYNLFPKTIKNRQEKSIAKVLHDHKTNILSNITFSNDIASPFLSNIIHYSFSSDCLFKMRRTNRCAIRNHKNENIFPANKKMLILNDKCYSALDNIKKNNSSDKIINRTLCDFQEPCLTNRQSNLKRKLEPGVINELYLGLGNRKKHSSKSTTYTERFDRIFSYSKHFKSDHSSQIYENGNEHFLLQPQFTNRIDSIENCNFKQMKNIEIQSSPVKIRVATNFGEDSVEYIDPTMEVELDSDESDPDESGEQTAEVAEEPLEHNQISDTNDGLVSGGDGNASEVNVANTGQEDSTIKTQSEHPNTSNETDDKDNSILKEHCLDQDTYDNMEANQNVSDKDVGADNYQEHELEKREETDAGNIKVSAETKGSSPCLSSLPKDMLTFDNKPITDIYESNRTENDAISLDKGGDEVNNEKLTSEADEHAIPASDTAQTELSLKYCKMKQHEEPERDYTKDKTNEINEVDNQPELSKNVEDEKLNEDENFEERAEICECDKKKDDGEKSENDEIERQEKVSKIAECNEMNRDDDATEKSCENENNKYIKQSKHISENEQEFLEDIICEFVQEQENELQENGNNQEAKEIIIEDKNTYDAEVEEANVDAKTLENLESIKNNYNERFQGNEKVEIKCIRQINDSPGDCESEDTKNNVICKIEEEENKTSVDSQNSEDIPDKIPENKDAEDIEIKSITSNGKITLNKIESCSEEIELEHESEESTEIEKEQIKENFQSHFETENEQIDNLKYISAEEGNFLEEKETQENLSHLIVKNEEDVIEKDSIEDSDNYQSADKQDTKSQNLCSILEKYESEESNPELSTNVLISTKEKSVSPTKSENAKEFDKIDFDILESETADEIVSNNNKHAKLKKEGVDDMTEKLSVEQQNENNFLNIEKVDGEKEEEMSQNDREGGNNNVSESSLTDIKEGSSGQIPVNDNGNNACEEEKLVICKSPMQESTSKESEETVCQINNDENVFCSSEKQKVEKPEHYSSDSAKVISPRKGIKVEEDEIETAISSIMFYDEMSDGSEQIVQTVPSAVFLESYSENEKISRENTSKSADAQKTIEEEADEIPSTNVSEEELPLQTTTEEGELASAETKVQPSTSLKNRKKKRKISRSRCTKKDGTSSATKRSLDSKGSARTARSISSTSARSPSAGEKKLPPIKAPVGTTPPPNVKQVRSKIGSLDNVTHKPKGGDKKVETVKLEWNAKSKIGSLDYASHKPGGGDKKILTQKLDFKNVQSKVGSKENLKHKPAGGNIKISTEKLDFKAKAASKVGSLDNAKHKPGGGNVTIKSEKLHFKERATPKLHSRSGSEKGSSHGGSETQSPVIPSSPAPPEELTPLNEDENPSSQEVKHENPQEKTECNGAGESTQEDPSNDTSQTKSEVANTANDANNDNNANDGENAQEDQLIAF